MALVIDSNYNFKLFIYLHKPKFWMSHYQMKHYNFYVNLLCAT